MIQISLPLSVVTYKPKTAKGKIKKWILNLNSYRNAHYRVLSLAKKEYHKLVASLLRGRGKLPEQVFLIYVYHHGNRRRIDHVNPCSVISKFTEDAITELGLWEDDDSKNVVGHLFLAGEVDKENPRCDLLIVPWKELKESLTSILKTAGIESSELEILGS